MNESKKKPDVTAGQGSYLPTLGARKSKFCSAESAALNSVWKEGLPSWWKQIFIVVQNLSMWANPKQAQEDMGQHH